MASVGLVSIALLLLAPVPQDAPSRADIPPARRIDPVHDVKVRRGLAVLERFGKNDAFVKGVRDGTVQLYWTKAGRFDGLVRVAKYPDGTYLQQVFLKQASNRTVRQLATTLAHEGEHLRGWWEAGRPATEMSTHRVEAALTKAVGWQPVFLPYETLVDMPDRKLRDLLIRYRNYNLSDPGLFSSDAEMYDFGTRFGRWCNRNLRNPDHPAMKDFAQEDFVAARRSSRVISAHPTLLSRTVRTAGMLGWMLDAGVSAVRFAEGGMSADEVILAYTPGLIASSITTLTVPAMIGSVTARAPVWAARSGVFLGTLAATIALSCLIESGMQESLRSLRTSAIPSNGTRADATPSSPGLLSLLHDWADR